MPSGPPKWSSTMVVSGKACARSVSSGNWGWNSQASKLRPRGASCAKPSRKSASSSRCSIGWLCGVADLLAGVPAGRMADAAKTVARSADMRFQHVAHGGAEAQVGEGDDARRHARVAIGAAGAHRGDAVDELGFTHGLERLRPIGAEHRCAFDEDRAAHVVALALGVGRAGVGQQFIEQVAVAVAIPQVVVRVDDGQRRIDDVLGLGLRQAGQARGRHGCCPAQRPGFERAPQQAQQQRGHEHAERDADGVGAQVAPFGRAIGHVELQQLDQAAKGQQSRQQAQAQPTRRAPAERGTQRQTGKCQHVVQLVPAQAEAMSAAPESARAR